MVMLSFGTKAIDVEVTTHTFCVHCVFSLILKLMENIAEATTITLANNKSTILVSQYVWR
jgi:hypothetical protein